MQLRNRSTRLLRARALKELTLDASRSASSCLSASVVNRLRTGASDSPRKSPLCRFPLRRSGRVAKLHAPKKPQQKEATVHYTVDVSEREYDAPSFMKRSIQKQNREQLKSPTRKKTKKSRRQSEERRQSLPYHLLQSAFSAEDKIDDTSWLTSTFIDLMLWRFALLYPSVHFLPTDFSHFHLESVCRKATVTGTPLTPADFHVRDVLGRVIEFTMDTPIVFTVNAGLIHWNLFRVRLHPQPELELFEPMGRLGSRTGISFRSVPRCVIEWLDVCYVQHKPWLPKTVSAITKQQQVSGFDCGVACLLYADKCGRGHSRTEMNDQIDQEAITSFRKFLQSEFRTFDGTHSPMQAEKQW